ncbi:hypothetical protein EVAR_21906_1 [Eumeta japonica]|uniref:Uncharacterized protein n=1 Tax=Eumeta variegata TaxID=151549 RepID=A0A4C1XJ53_EUMVA|nr:hypothetical protein EVAR_21906_1 [Eumeta japonica]
MDKDDILDAEKFTSRIYSKIRPSNPCIAEGYGPLVSVSRVLARSAPFGQENEKKYHVHHVEAIAFVLVLIEVGRTLFSARKFVPARRHDRAVGNFDPASPSLVRDRRQRRRVFSYENKTNDGGLLLLAQVSGEPLTPIGDRRVCRVLQRTSPFADLRRRVPCRGPAHGGARAGVVRGPWAPITAAGRRVSDTRTPCDPRVLTCYNKYATPKAGRFMWTAWWAQSVVTLLTALEA